MNAIAENKENLSIVEELLSLPVGRQYKFGYTLAKNPISGSWQLIDTEEGFIIASPVITRVERGQRMALSGKFTLEGKDKKQQYKACGQTDINNTVCAVTVERVG